MSNEDEDVGPFEAWLGTEEGKRALKEALKESKKFDKAVDECCNINPQDWDKLMHTPMGPADGSGRW
jgi:hypothetical protein